MAISCIVCDLLVENREIFITPPVFSDPVGILWNCSMLVKLVIGLPYGEKNCDDIICSAVFIWYRNVTDGQTDGQTDLLYQYRTSVCWRAIKMVFDRRAVALLRSTYSWRVTTYVGKPSAIGQPTRPTQPFILSGSIMSSKLQVNVVTIVCGGAIWWTRTKARDRHGVVCRLNCVIHVWAPWGRDTCHLGGCINPRTFTFYLFTSV